MQLPHNVWASAKGLFTYPFVRLVLVLLGALFSYLLARRFFIATVHRLAKKTRNEIDDILIQHRLVDLVVYILPILVIHYGALLVPSFALVMERVVSVAWVVLLALLADRLLSVGLTLYERHPIARKRPLKGYVQVVKIVVYAAAIIAGLCTLLDKSPWGFLSGLGALSAVLILIFRHTILSFVASFQVISQDLIRVGDWIEMPKYGADGEVIDIALHTIEIRNWDKTYVVVPTYKLLEESFKNWRGMSEAGGRRIKRALLIDKSTVKLCDEHLIERFRRIHLIATYVEVKVREIQEYNRQQGIDVSASPVNGRQMTNLGTFRIYMEEYLRHHPKIRKDMTLMVRQREPTPEGLPLEVYCFVADTRWVSYERIQADIFDHFLAVVGEFDLRVVQIPTGSDLREAVMDLAKGR